MKLKLDFDPYARAECLMATANASEGADGWRKANEMREEVRDLLLLSIAQSLRELAKPPLVSVFDPKIGVLKEAW